MSSRIQLRRSLGSQWSNVNPVLAQGELGYEIDTGRFKIGNGESNWDTLPYFTIPPTDVSELANSTGYITSSSLPTKLSDLEDDINFLTQSNFNSSPAGGITSTQITNWNTAYSWGNHNVAGYLLTNTAANTYQLKNNNLDTFVSISNNLNTQGLLRKVLNTSGGYDWILDPSNYVTSADLGNINSTSINNWNTAYSWGNHATAGYITSITAENRYQLKDDDLTAIGAITANTGLLRKVAANSWTLDTNTYLTTTGAAATYQPLDGDLTAIAVLTGNSGILRKTGENLWTLDTSSYLTTTSAATTYQPLNANLTNIVGLPGNTGLLRKTAANTWTLDTATYLTANQTVTLSGDATGSGTTSISVTLANSGVGAGTYRSVTVDVKGRVTAGTNPTTVSGYGITDSLSVVSVPANPTSTGTAGQVAYDATHFYICTATNTWRRAALTTW